MRQKVTWDVVNRAFFADVEFGRSLSVRPEMIRSRT